MSAVVALVEHDGGEPDGLSLETLTFARGLAEGAGLPLHAVVLGEAARSAAERLGAFGASAVHVVVHERLVGYSPTAWARALADIVGRLLPQAVVAPGSDRGSEVMAHLAARMELPMAVNCTDVELGDPGDPCLVTRLRWGGSLLEEARLSGSVKLLTVAPHAVAAEETASGAPAVIQDVTPTLEEEDLLVRVVDREAADSAKVSLPDARVVVGGGRGVGGAEGFAMLEELAGLLGGAVGCSRVATSLGWRPHADQIGQTGSRIAPELYIACGISGAIQHIVGCKAAKRILAINVDPEAPIMGKAHYAVIGDLHQVLPALASEIRRVQQGRRD